MSKVLKVFHYIGLVMFLGSIFTYMLISALATDGSLTNLVFARRIIWSGSIFLTLPGMWLILISGIFMTVRDYGFFKHRWLNIKHIVIVVIILNAHLIIAPAVGEALRHAQESLAKEEMLPAYYAAYLRESVFGAVNVILTVVSMVVAVRRFRR